MNSASPTKGIEEIPTTNPFPPDEESINPLDLIVQLERELAISQAALRKIKRMRLSEFAGGPSNQNFGQRPLQAFTKCKEVADEALSRLETEYDNGES